MGADLYIKNMERVNQTKRGFEVSNAAVSDGYFRDLSENLGQDFSWWQTADRSELFVRDPENGLLMTVEGAKQWLDELKPHLAALKRKQKLYYRQYKEEKRREIPAEEVKEYRNWADLLLKFLELAIKLESPIIWSV